MEEPYNVDRVTKGRTNTNEVERPERIVGLSSNESLCYFVGSTVARFVE